MSSLDYFPSFYSLICVLIVWLYIASSIFYRSILYRKAKKEKCIIIKVFCITEFEEGELGNKIHHHNEGIHYKLMANKNEMLRSAMSLFDYLFLWKKQINVKKTVFREGLIIDCYMNKNNGVCLDISIMNRYFGWLLISFFVLVGLLYIQFEKRYFYDEFELFAYIIISICYIAYSVWGSRRSGIISGSLNPTR